jgi:hypothetical protein
MLIMQVRPAYSIPSSLEEFQKMFGNLCYEYGLDFCASPPKSEEEGNKRKEFGEREKQIGPHVGRRARNERSHGQWACVGGAR